MQSIASKQFGLILSTYNKNIISLKLPISIIITITIDIPIGIAIAIAINIFMIINFNQYNSMINIKIILICLLPIHLLG